MVAALNALALLVFGGMSLLAVFKRHWTLVLLFCFFGYEQLLSTSMGILASKPWLINVSVGLISLTAVGMALTSGKRPFRGAFNPNSFLVFALIVFSYLGMFYGGTQNAGAHFVRTGFPYMVLLLGVLPCLVTGTEVINRMCTPYLLAGCALVVMVLLSPRAEFSGSRMYLDLSYTMGAGEKGNPLAIAEIGGIMVIIGALMRQTSKSLVIAALRVGGIILGITICFFSASRGQLIFSILVAVMFFPVAYQIRNAKQFFIRAGMLGTMAAIMLFVAKRFLFSSEASERFSGESLTSGVDSRMYYAKTLLGEYFSKPGQYLQGMGTGSFNLFVEAGSGEGFSYPHNLFVEILADHGLIGFGLLLLIILVSGIHTYKLLRMVHSGIIERHAVAIVLAISGYVTLISMKQGSYLVLPLPFYAYLILSKLYYTRIAELADAGEEVYEPEYAEYADEEYQSVGAL
ncbi:MAG: O-antigen ligase family protein [Phycisphaerales bacterium]|nr:O-antigen ligase family protein [Phycisphaerales bacterium]